LKTLLNKKLHKMPPGRICQYICLPCLARAAGVDTMHCDAVLETGPLEWHAAACHLGRAQPARHHAAAKSSSRIVARLA
jgi:hypothetical protein